MHNTIVYNINSKQIHWNKHSHNQQNLYLNHTDVDVYVSVANCQVFSWFPVQMEKIVTDAEYSREHIWCFCIHVSDIKVTKHMKTKGSGC